jgi:hemolysin III
VALVVVAPGATVKTACAVYAASLCMLLGTSAVYHLVTWKKGAVRQRMKQLDHSAIFVLIAGTYTPMALTLDSQSAFRMLAVAWAGAALGISKALFWVHGPRWIVAALAVAVGWLAVLYGGQLMQALGGARMAWLGLGGIFYSVGALIYALKRPDPWPSVFGYHEVFHMLVVAGAVCHFAVISQSLETIRGAVS